MNMNIFDDYYDWTSDITDIEEIKVKITGRYWNKSFNHDNLTLKTDQIIKNLKLTSILDYGAGMGRNLPLLRKYAPIVDYLDLETYKPHTSELNYDNKFYIQIEPLPLNKKYDLIYASVVIQHIVDKELLQKIIEFMQKSSKYIFIVQNVKFCFYDFDNHFQLIHTESYKDDFLDFHFYNLYESIKLPEEASSQYKFSHFL